MTLVGKSPLSVLLVGMLSHLPPPLLSLAGAIREWVASAAAGPGPGGDSGGEEGRFSVQLALQYVHAVRLQRYAEDQP